MEQGVAFRGCARNAGSGGSENRSPGTTTRAARSLLHGLRRKCRSRERGPEAQNRHGVERREARRPDRKGRRGDLASAPARRVTQAKDACVTRRATGASQAPGACRRSPTPRFGVEKLQTPGANASRERERLSDIVREDGNDGFEIWGNEAKPRSRRSARARRAASLSGAQWLQVGRTKPTDENAGIAMRPSP